MENRHDFQKIKNKIFKLPVICLYFFQISNMTCVMSEAAKGNIIIFQFY